MKECWICRRTEDDFKRLLRNDDLGEEFFYPAPTDEAVTELFGDLHMCWVCFELFREAGDYAISYIEDSHFR